MHWWLVASGWYVIMSVVTLGAYWWDKRAASKRAWRTREKTLHLLALAGGWPGALAGQALFRHKTKKLRFKVILWAIVVLHVGAWAGVLWLTVAGRGA